jgi:hypothetical protein
MGPFICAFNLERIFNFIQILHNEPKKNTNSPKKTTFINIPLIRKIE